MKKNKQVKVTTYLSYLYLIKLEIHRRFKLLEEKEENDRDKKKSIQLDDGVILKQKKSGCC